MSSQPLAEYLEQEKARMRSQDLVRLHSGQVTAEELQEENSLWPRTATARIVNFHQYVARIQSKLHSKAPALAIPSRPQHTR